MNYTSAQANKLLKKLNDEYTALLDKETRSRDFRAAMGEDVESVRPVYDYAETQIRLAELEAKIRKLKHAINIFNATQTVDSFDMTIDELLVYIPQLTKRKSKLLEMKSRLPKERVEERPPRYSPRKRPPVPRMPVGIWWLPSAPTAWATGRKLLERR